MNKYPGSKLMFTDTDSLCFWTPYEGNIYQGLYLNNFSLALSIFLTDISSSPWIDFSNYPKPDPASPVSELYDISKNYSEHLKLVPGYFKDDMGGKVIREFVGLR